jgi:hypothetical protein
MRRILLGGLGLALGIGVFARPALSQNRPARATLGLPVAVPEVNPGVTPAGLLDRRPLFGAPVGAKNDPVSAAAPNPLGQPRTLGGFPSLTEVRGPSTGGVPSAVPVPNGVPSAVPMTIVPSMVPEDCPIETFPAPGAAAVDRIGTCRNPRWWVSAESLLWWTKSTQLPPIVTTSLPADNGILGAPSTIPLLAGSFGSTAHGGTRIAGGTWFSDEQYRGIDWRFMFLFSSGQNFSANTASYPLLARPFFNVNNPVGPYSEVIGAPGLANGGVSVNLDNSLWGAEVNYRRFLRGNGCARLDGIAGFRYLNFTENMTITESFLRTPDSAMGVGTPATSGIVQDSFRAENQFYGGQLGLVGEVRRGRWFANARTSIALGTVQQTATIGGGQALAFANGTVGQYGGGLLALPGANQGSWTQNKFAVMPEIGLNIGYHITPHLRVFAGYNFLYLSNVLRASGTIDQNVDAARIPNFPVAGATSPLYPPRPAPEFRTTDFWAQGVNFGLQWTW